MIKLRKQLLIVILLIAAILAGSIPTFALPDKTTQQKADALSAINIITGTNGQYNLGSQLKRSEAITYMIRLIGKADYVVQNKAVYSTTPFSDVASNQWYAPYIGYASEFGFISKASTQFKPLDFITDKDFIRLALIALDYREGIDFTADNIFEKARDIGLVNLTYYVYHFNQTTITTRSTAVDIIYSALSLKTRPGDKLLCQKLLDEGAATRKQLTALGFIEDKKVTQISQINTLDLDKLEIKFNENVTLISGVRAYVKDSPSVVLGCSVQSLAGNTMTLLTSTIDVTKEYVVELTGVQDEEGNVADLVQKSFKGFESQQIISNFFRISKVEAVNDRSLKVYFTHPVTLNSEVCLYYSILKDNTVIAEGKQGVIKAGIMNSNKNAVVLSINGGTLNGGDLYSLKIEGDMMSAYGAKMNNGLGDSMKFVVGKSDDLRFELKQVTAVDKKILLLSFSKEVNSFLAEQIYNFYLTDENNNAIRISSTAMNVNGDGVYLNLGQDLNKSKKYWLTINNLNDVTKQEYITEQKFDFLADYGTVSDFIINGINVPDNRTIELAFNRPLDESTAVNAAYYTISGGYYSGIHPERVIYDPTVNPYKVKLLLSKHNMLNGQNIYSIRVESGMKDNMGNSTGTTGVNFTGSSTQRLNTAIENVVPISLDSVKVTFTEEIAFNASNLSPSNFALEYTFNRNNIKKIPVSVIFIDATTLVLRFDAIDYNTAYKLKIGKLLDFTDNTSNGLEKGFELKAE